MGALTSHRRSLNMLPFDAPFSMDTHGSWTMVKQYGIKIKVLLETLRESIGKLMVTSLYHNVIFNITLNPWHYECNTSITKPPQEFLHVIICMLTSPLWNTTTQARSFVPSFVPHPLQINTTMTIIRDATENEEKKGRRAHLSRRKEKDDEVLVVLPLEAWQE